MIKSDKAVLRVYSYSHAVQGHFIHGFGFLVSGKGLNPIKKIQLKTISDAISIFMMRTSRDS